MHSVHDSQAPIPQPILCFMVNRSPILPHITKLLQFTAHKAPSHKLVFAVITIFITTFLFTLPLERPRCMPFSFKTKRGNHHSDNFFTWLCGKSDAPLQHTYKNKSTAAVLRNEERMMMKSFKWLLPWQKAQK